MITDTIVMDLEQIKKVIPQRYPLLLVDTVHELVLNERIVASKLLLPEEPVFAGHFPGNPVYPGVYFIESLAQTGAILLFSSDPSIIGNTGLLAGIEEARFRKPCKPGDKVVFEVIFEKKRGMFYWIKGRAFIGKDTAAEAKISVALIKQD